MVFEKFFCSKLSKNHSEFEKRKKKDFSLPDSRIEKSHQIEPTHTTKIYYLRGGKAVMKRAKYRVLRIMTQNTKTGA